jgi:hypothetical protein
MFSSNFCPILAIENLKRALDYSTLKVWTICFWLYRASKKRRRLCSSSSRRPISSTAYGIGPWCGPGIRAAVQWDQRKRPLWYPSCPIRRCLEAALVLRPVWSDIGQGRRLCRIVSRSDGATARRLSLRRLTRLTVRQRYLRASKIVGLGT